MTVRELIEALEGLNPNAQPMFVDGEHMVDVERVWEGEPRVLSDDSGYETVVLAG